MTDTPAPYGFCPICGGLGRSRERRPNGDDRCENGHTYPSSKALKSGEILNPGHAATIQPYTPEMEAEVEQLKKEVARLTRKNDALMDRLSKIEAANVDRWEDGYVAAERQIAAWLDEPCGLSGHDDRWCPACSFRAHLAVAIRDGAHRPVGSKKGKT